MDPVLMQLRFVVGESESVLPVSDWAECLNKTVMKLVESADGGGKSSFLCKALSQLLVPCGFDRTLSNEVVHSCNLPALIPLLCRRVAAGSAAAAECLKTVMHFFPGPCGSFKNIIEATLLQAIDADHGSQTLMVSSAECWGLLPFCGGGGVKHAQRKESWRKQASESLVTLHGVLTNIFMYIPGALSTPAGIGHGLSLRKLPQTSHHSLMAGLVRRFSSLTEFFISMMTVDSLVAVDLPIAVILVLVERTFSVSERSLLTASEGGPTKSAKQAAKKSIFSSILVKYLPQIYLSVLRLLRAVVLSCGGVPLLEYSRAIGRMLANALEWTVHVGGEKKYDENWKPSEDIMLKARREAYACLGEWIEASKGVAFPKSTDAKETPLHRIWHSVWADFSRPADYSAEPVKAQKPYGDVDNEVVELWGLSKKEKKQRKRKLGLDMVASSRKRLKSRGDETVSFRDLAACDDVASERFLSAGRCIRVLIQFCGHRLSAKMYTDLSENVVKLLGTADGEDTEGKSVIGLLYRRPECREAVYDILLCLATSAPTLDQWSAPSSTFVSLLGRGTSDPDPVVSGSCARALTLYAAATLRPPRLTLEWSRRVPAVSVEPMGKPRPGESEGEEDVEEPFEVEIGDDDSMEVPEEIEIISASVAKAKGKVTSEKPSRPVDVSVEVVDEEVIDLGDEDEDNDGIVEVVRDDTVASTDHSSEAPAEDITEEVSALTDDLPSVLDMLAAFTDA